MKLNATQWALIGLAVQFLVVVRSLAEYFRLKALGAGMRPESFEPFIVGALVAAGSGLVSSVLLLAGRPRLALVLSIAIVPLLLAYRIMAFR
jgi:cytochrome c oxidase subunit IV